MPALPLIIADDVVKQADMTSATLINTWLECERKFGFRYLAKVYPAPAASAQLGTDTHKQNERYLADETPFDFTHKSGDIAASGLHLYPKPRTPGMRLEREFRFRSVRTSIVYYGLKDVELPPGLPQPQLRPSDNAVQLFAVPKDTFDGSKPGVLDFKTTASIGDYAKTPDDLRYDAQGVLYAVDSCARYDSDAADLGWLYLQTRGAKRSLPVVQRIPRDHALRLFDVIEDEAVKAARVRAEFRAQDKSATDFVNEQLAPNPAACGAFGGCPYKHLCTLTTSQRAKSRMSGNSIIANLRNRVQAAPTVDGAKAVVISPPEPATTPAPEAPTVAPAEEKLPDWATSPVDPLKAKTEQPVAINPPESKLPLVPQETATTSEDKPKRTRTKKDKGPPPAPKDPLGANVHAHTSAPTPEQPATDTKYEETKASGEITPEKKELEETIAATVVPPECMPQREGFTLYVDCLPIGRPVKTLAPIIEKAQQRIFDQGPRDRAGNAVSDYRLIGFGEGVPPFIAYVCEQIDGSQDLVLDTRTPEGAVLLESLMARAAFVVRGLR